MNSQNKKRKQNEDEKQESKTKDKLSVQYNNTAYGDFGIVACPGTNPELFQMALENRKTTPSALILPLTGSHEFRSSAVGSYGVVLGGSSPSSNNNANITTELSSLKANSKEIVAAEHVGTQPASNIQKTSSNTGNIIWVHCAIPVEKEQAKIVLEKAFSGKFVLQVEHGKKQHLRLKVKVENNEFTICLSSNSSNQRQGSLFTYNELNAIKQQFNPCFVFMPGICGGNPKLVKRGDVIVMERAVPSHFGTQDLGTFRHDATASVNIDGSILDPIHDIPSDWIKCVDETILSQLKLTPKIHVGPTLCSDIVRSDISPDEWKKVQLDMATKKVYGVECEALPLYSTFPNRSLCLKGVQDFAFEKQEDTEKYRVISAQLSAAVVASYIQHFAVMFFTPS